MQFIVNATFTINVSRTDIGIMEDIEVSTIEEVIEETANELGIQIDDHVVIRLISAKKGKKTPTISSAKRRQLSSTDIKLLNAAYANRKNCILITDDKQIRVLAKSNNIRSYTTPQFIGYMINNNMITTNRGAAFLDDLKRIYIRPKDIDSVLRRIRKWR
jgi:hypothetical protein